MSKTKRRRNVFGDLLEEDGNKKAKKQKFPKGLKETGRKKERLQVKSSMRKVAELTDEDIAWLEDEEDDISII